MPVEDHETLFDRATWYLGNTLIATTLTFAILVMITLPLTIRLVGDQAVRIVVLSLIGLSGFLAQRNLMGEEPEDPFEELSMSLKVAAGALSFSYYNLLVIVTFFVWVITDTLFGSFVAAMVAVGYPMYDVWTFERTYAPGLGRFIQIFVYLTGFIVESAILLREISITETLFVLFERARHPRTRL